MTIDPTLTLGGALVGFVVGLTGMGGGALMTPMLIFFFGVNPLTAVSSDLLASLVMKPVGGLVHLRRGTVNKQLVKYLCIGSIPAAFAGVMVLRVLGSFGPSVSSVVQISLGAALLLAVLTMVAKGILEVRRRGHEGRDASERERPEFRVRVAVTITVGAIGGLVVGMTSVGSGSLIIVALLVAYPRLTSRELVGTDLVQAVPLVASAALGHLLFGHIALGLTASLLIGAVPATWLGARLSSRAPQMVVRRTLAIILLASALKLLSVPTAPAAAIVVAAIVAGPLGWMVVRRVFGLPMLFRTERRLHGQPSPT